MSEWYKEDLAYIHDVGFGDYALGSAPGVLEILARNGTGGLVAEAACGPGSLRKSAIAFSGSTFRRR